ncbi:hypothetical protein JYU34_021581 [Plutella xylostella]|uniref:Uncharacterized protein n=1 Tax=Plutella xylostella TaxID=51655 RepID=A0ABQ7PU40_PLUXY|nr:hypothetical protein JYU34_021581 [Plutella xylostella]
MEKTSKDRVYEASTNQAVQACGRGEGSVGAQPAANVDGAGAGDAARGRGGGGARGGAPALARAAAAAAPRGAHEARRRLHHRRMWCGADPAGAHPHHQLGEPDPHHVHVGAHSEELPGGGRDGAAQHPLHGRRGARHRRLLHPGAHQ